MPQAQDINQGDDIGGVVHEVGTEVTEFKKGDRVAAFHEMLKPGGGWAEYSVAWDWTTFLLPENTSFEGTSSGHGRFNDIANKDGQRVLPFHSPH
jgi:NADPH:quinone reductase-like Zn-dependent oxidoreductase